MTNLRRISESVTQSPRSPATTPSSPPVPDSVSAAKLGAIIDRARAAVGWGRLPEKEHDIWVVSWFEILADAGVPEEGWDASYRAAQNRKRELLRQGQALTIVTPHDICDEWDKVRAMHAELDNTRLLPETATSVCPRCDGTGLERMPNGARRPGCKHQFTPGEEAAHVLERDAETVKQKAAEMREALSKMASVKAMPAVSIADKITVTFTCTECRRKVSSEFGWAFNDPCGARLPGPVREGERHACVGLMKVL